MKTPATSPRALSALPIYRSLIVLSLGCLLTACSTFNNTDLMFAAFRQLFPAERMVVCGGYKSEAGVRVTSGEARRADVLKAC